MSVAQVFWKKKIKNKSTYLEQLATVVRVVVELVQVAFDAETGEPPARPHVVR